MNHGLVVGICPKCHNIKIINTFDVQKCDFCTSEMIKTDMTYSQYVYSDKKPEDIRKELIISCSLSQETQT